MSREPFSPMMRNWDAYREKPQPPTPTVEKPKPGPPKQVPRIGPTRREKQRERVMAKWMTSTEALTAEERQIIRGYRISRRDLGMED